VCSSDLGHPVALRHAEELNADLAGALDDEEALRPPALEDEVAVGEVVENDRSGALRPLHGLSEDAGRRSLGGRVSRIVEVQRRGGLDRVEAGERAAAGTRKR